VKFSVLLPVTARAAPILLEPGGGRREVHVGDRQRVEAEGAFTVRILELVLVRTVDHRHARAGNPDRRSWKRYR